MAAVSTQESGFPEVVESEAIRNFDWNNPDYVPIIKERAQRLSWLRDEEHGAKRLLALKLFYRTRVVEFIQDWGVTYDPRNAEVNRTVFMPFLLFPKQKQFIHWVEERRRKREDGVTEKSRDMGISWLMMMYGIHQWLFFSGVKIGYGSYKEIKIDKLGDPDSLFEKGRIILDNLPVEFLPRGYNKEEHAPSLKFVNPENGSTLTGEAGNNIGRGGRASIYFIDEAAFFEQPERAEAALSQVSNVRIWSSTAHGTGNPFYRKVTSGKFPKFRFHWTEDPRKNQEWYEQQKNKLEPHILAAEVDIDYTASIDNVVIPGKWVEAARVINTLIRDWPRSSLGVAGLDIGGGGAGKTVYVSRFGPWVDPPRSWEGGNPTHDAIQALQLAREDGVYTLCYDPLGVGIGSTSTFETERAQRDITTAVPPEFPFEASKTRRIRTQRAVEVLPINVGSPPSETLWDDDRTSSEKFANTRAELWWLMRDRFQKTYEHILYLRGDAKGRKHSLDELISLPDDPTLQTQLSMPTWGSNASGKVILESKRSMSRRGVESPDFADALALTFAPAVTLSDFSTDDFGGFL